VVVNVCVSWNPRYMQLAKVLKSIYIYIYIYIYMYTHTG
jgi:hypothetical protein